MNQDIFRLEDAILVEYGRMETGITGQETIFYKLESFYIFKIFSFVDSEFPLCKGFPGGSDGEESTYNAGDVGLIHGWGKITWRREWLPTPVCLPGEPHGQRSLVGCSPCVPAQSLQSYLTLHTCGLWPTRFLCPGDSPRKNTGVGCHDLLQGIFLTQGSNPRLLHPLPSRQILYHQATRGSPGYSLWTHKQLDMTEPTHFDFSYVRKMSYNIII